MGPAVGLIELLEIITEYWERPPPATTNTPRITSHASSLLPIWLTASVPAPCFPLTSSLKSKDWKPFISPQGRAGERNSDIIRTYCPWLIMSPGKDLTSNQCWNQGLFPFFREKQNHLSVEFSEIHYRFQKRNKRICLKGKDTGKWSLHQRQRIWEKC